MNLNGSITITAQLEGSKQQGIQMSNEPSRDPVMLALQTLFQNGTGAGQVNKQIHRDVDIADGVTHTYDLASGLTDSFGDAVAMTAAKILVFQNDGAVNLELNGSSGLTPLMTVRPGGIVVVIAPDATGYPTAGGNGQMTVQNASGAAGSYRFVVAGIQ